jgi:threonine dehydratase
MSLTLNDIETTARKISPYLVRTPCAHSKTLSDITGAHVILKFENHQFTASFKERGALAKLLSLTEPEREKGVIAASAGNHAQAVAYHAQRLGIPATIVMPRFTPNVKVENTRRFGARVILEGKIFDEAQTYAITYAKENRLIFIPPYDDEKVISGQGTIALEMLETYPDLEALIISIGGGGLISGNAIAAKGLKKEIAIFGVQSARFPSMAQTIQGKPLQCGSQTIAEGIAVKHPGKLTLPIVRTHVDDIFLVEEHEIEAAVLLLLEVEKTVVEGAGAAGLAALIQQRSRFKGKKVGLILSGGNIDLIALSSIIQRGLVRSGRLARLVVGIPDVPGALAEITQILGHLNANIIEIRHQRTFTNLSLKLAEVEFVLQTLGNNHIREIRETLERSGYHATFVTSALDLEL